MWFRLSGGGGSSGGSNTSTGNSDQSSGRGSCGSSEGDAVTTAKSPSTSHISAELTSAATVTNGNEMPDGGKPARSARETSKFEKFRRASFRRKSSTANNSSAGSRKRSKSPHAILQADKSFSSLEEEAIEEDQTVETDMKEKTAALKLLLATASNNDNDQNKKMPLKPIKTDPPKRKFYKFASMRRQNSDDKRSQSVENDAIEFHNKTLLKKLPKIDDSAIDSGNNEDKSETIVSTDEDDEDDDNDDVDNNNNDQDDDDDEKDNDEEEKIADVESDKKRKCKKGKNQKNVQPKEKVERCKEKILLTDPKFKNNRVEKSSSKTKLNNGHSGSVAGDKLEKRESIKRSRSARKISAPPILVDNVDITSGNNNNNSNIKKGSKKSEKEPPRSRAHSTHLNLQALVKLMVSNKKFLNTDDFALIRRKSISEAASTMIAVAACKPLPIALKYTPENVVAEAPKEYDAKAERNVVLVKKQNLTNSFCDRLNSNNNNYNNMNNNNNDNSCNINNKGGDNDVRVRKTVDKELLKRGGLIKATDICTKVKRNSSNSSKSSGNFEDEAFYSCDEVEAERIKNGLVDDKIDEEEQQQMQIIRKQLDNVEKDDSIKRKSSSPSLTSRVAAKINETTNIYKNRKAAKSAKKRKAQANATEKRPELYKQISVERLHSASVVRQPSDRRPDAASSRTNSSTSTGAHNNNNDLQNSFHESRDVVSTFDGSFAAGGSASSNAGVGGVNTASATLDNEHSGSGGIGAGVMGTDANSLDADSKDASKKRLHLQNKSAPVSVNRSESYKERLSNKRNRNRRKTSDPSLTSRPNEDQSDLGLSNSNYTASSNSSLSSGGGSESPSTSMEQVANAATNVPPHHNHHQHHHYGHSNSVHGHHSGVHHAHQHSHQDSFHSSSGGSTSFWGGSNQLTRQWNFESDEDDDLHEADWSSMVTADLLAALTDAEKKRQEIINEIYQTERSHVRTLKLLERLFFCPLQESGVLSQDHLMLLFPPSLMTLRELHSAFEQKLKQRRLENNHVVQHVGDLLAHMFDGQSGEELSEFARQFCARQQIALEALKEKRRKDEQLQKLLSKAESHKACRRLQLKDLLPTVLQRLTKYPLLFENLYKVTVRVLPENTSEAEAIQRALESSKKILVDVNQAVKTAEDAHKLQNIQRKLDKSTFDKDEFKNLDLTQNRLIFDGNLTLKKSPSIQLHGLLFEDMILLLTKQDDKYSLKYLQQHTTARNNEVNSKPVSPIMNIMDTIARQDAADKNSFFLIKTKTSQMLELRAPSSSESKTWFKHITDAAEQYKRSKHATTETVDDPAIVTIPHSSTKESLELTSERPASMAATATVTITPLAPMIPPPTVTAIATTYITPSHNNINNNNNNSNNNNNHQHPYYNNLHNNNNHNGSNDSLGGVQLRNNGRRESTPIYSMPPPSQHSGGAFAGGSPLPSKSTRHSHNELTPGSSTNLSMNSGSASSLSPVVNRTMSTRSCGAVETPTSSTTNSAGVTLRHTQSARQATAQDAAELDASRRDSNSIVYAHNPNNTRTLLQTAPPLIDPSAVQISITPVHICETPAERLRRLDGNIREGLLEKQRIICDMFRLPVEHFHEIVDIAAMPEAPKDSADIALAAYAQVQSLTEVLNEYLQITPAQESAAISAASTNGCAQCHDKQAPPRPMATYANSGSGSSSCSSSSITPVTVSERTSPSSGVPPPLPPPNKQQPAGQTATHTNMPKLQTAVMNTLENATNIHEDDDGYCEIDELRLPSLAATASCNKTKTAAVASTSSSSVSSSSSPALPPPVGSCKATQVAPPSPPLSATTAATTSTAPTVTAAAAAPTTTAATATSNTTELTKRQSTISADSIPEESAEEITRALADDDNGNDNGNDGESNEEPPLKVIRDNNDKTTEEKSDETRDDELSTDNEIYSNMATAENDGPAIEKESNDGEKTLTPTPSSSDINEKKELIEQDKNTDSTDAKSELAGDVNSENKVMKPVLVDVDTQTTLSLCPNNVVNTNTTTIITIGSNNNNSTAATATYENCNHNSTLNGPIRIQHANNIEPSVPCHALSSIVCALNTHISLLLPTINERDLERERLRKENQRLRELLNAMQRERPRVESKMETPTDITLSSTAATNSTTPTTTTTAAAGNAADECDGPAVTSNTETNPEPAKIAVSKKSADKANTESVDAAEKLTTCNTNSTTISATDSNDLH